MFSSRGEDGKPGADDNPVPQSSPAGQCLATTPITSCNGHTWLLSVCPSGQIRDVFGT